MKYFKTLLLIITAACCIGWALSPSVHAAEPRSDFARAYQVFTPSSPYVVTISEAGDVDVSDYKLVMFGSNLTIYWGSDSDNTYPYKADTPLGVDSNATTIHVSEACKMMVKSK